MKAARTDPKEEPVPDMLGIAITRIYYEMGLVQISAKLSHTLTAFLYYLCICYFMFLEKAFKIKINKKCS